MLSTLDAKWLGLFYILATALLWSFLGVLAKLCLLSGLNPLQCSLLRASFGCLCFFGHCYFSKSLHLPLRDRLILILFGVWAIGVYYTLAQYTIMLAGASMDIILQYTAPFWVALFSKVFFHERLNTSQILAMVVAAFGTICVCSSGGSLAYKAPLLGICTGLITGICYASHYPFTRIWQKKYSSATIFFHLLLGGSLGIFIFSCLCYPENLSLFTKAGSFAPKVWLAAAAMGIFCTYLAFVCFGLALKKIGLVQAVITSEIEPVFSIFWVWLFYDENFSALGWLGSFAILASVLLLSVAKAHEG